LKTGSSGYVFAAKTLVAKKKWMQDLNNAIVAVQELNGVAPTPLARGAGGADSGAKPPPPSSNPPSRPAAAASKPAKKSAGKQAYEEWVIPSKVRLSVTKVHPSVFSHCAAV
jgi:hypothetical protein